MTDNAKSSEDQVGQWEPPRCKHGYIILGCPHDLCDEQNDYLAAQRAAIDSWYERRDAEARRVVRELLGLPT